jgi:hypothetical protein
MEESPTTSKKNKLYDLVLNETQNNITGPTASQ